MINTNQGKYGYIAWRNNVYEIRDKRNLLKVSELLILNKKYLKR